MNTTPLGIHIPDANPEDRAPQLRIMALDIDALFARVLPTVLTADANAVSSNALTPIVTPVMGSQNGLTRNVLSGISYTFETLLFITATDGEGLQIDLNGGSAGMTWIKAKAKGYDGSSAAAATLAFVSPTITSLSTPFGPQNAFSGWVEIEGSFVPSGNGTFIPRIAQTAHGSGSVQVLKGSTNVAH